MNRDLTVLEALLALQDSTREQISELWITRAAVTTMHCVLTKGKGPSGEVAGEDLQAQLNALASSGLTGGLRIAWNDTGAYVRLWSSDTAQRERFEERVSRAIAKDALDLLGAGGRVRVARWRSELAMSALKREISATVAAGVPKRSAALIADVNRLTVDDAVDKQPSPHPEKLSPAQPEAGAPEAERASSALIRMKAGHSAPCVVCGTPATDELDGAAIHRGMCLELFHENRAREENGAPEPAVARPASSVNEGSAAPRRARRKTGSASSFGVRPSIVLDAEVVGLPDGSQVEHPFPVNGWADVAQMGVHFEVGTQVGTWREDGQVWVTAALLEQIGPRVDAAADFDLRTYSESSKGAPELLEAARAGWSIGYDPEPSLGRWNTMRRGSDRVRIALIPLMLSHAQLVNEDEILKSDVPVLAGNPSPGELAHRLAVFADAYKFPYKVTPQTTAFDYLQRFDYRGTNPQALFAPGVMPNIGSLDVEMDADYTRVPFADERELKFVHAYDRGGSYLTGISGGLKVGVGTPTHVDGPMAITANTYGFHRIAALPDAGDTRDPHPLVPAVGQVPKGPFWRSSISIAWAIERGYDVEILESWIWPETHPAFSAWYNRVRDARATLLSASEGSVDHELALAQLKAVYTRFIGQMGSSGTKGKPGYAPDRRLAILARARVNLHRFIINAGNTSGRWPLAWENDTILYASDDPDPRTAFPGADEKWGRGIGQLRWEGSGLMADHLKHLHGGPWTGKRFLRRTDLPSS